MTFETRCVECNSVLFVDRYKPMTIAECHFKRFIQATISRPIVDLLTEATVAGNNISVNK